MSRYLFLSIFISIAISSYSQDINENIKTQKIIVSKSYTPELTNINKIRSVTTVNDMLISKKVTVTYELIDVPVISTFKPNKASPLTLKRNNISEPSFGSYFDFGLGNKSQFNIDYSTNIDIDRSQSIGIDIINTSYGKVNSTLISSDESRFIFGVNHIHSSKRMEVFHKISLNQHKINFYGISQDSSVLSDPLLLNRLKTDQTTNRINILSNWRLYNTFLKGVVLDINFITDSFYSNEENVDLKIDIMIPVFRMNLLMTPKISYLNTFFKESYFDRININSSYTKLETSILLSSLEGRFKYQFGGRINYMLNQSNQSATNFLISPKVMISYGKNSSKFQPYLTIDGGIKINKYSSFLDLNPYVAPSLNIIPTENIYDANLGFKSSFDSGLELDIGAHFKKEINSPLFNRYAYDPSVVDQGYRLANSFGILYDDIVKYGLYGEMSINFYKENLIKISVLQANYDLDKTPEPWNLPNIEGRLVMDIKLLKKLRINISARHIGKRPSAYKQVFLNQLPENSPFELKVLPSITQIKTEVNYKLISRWQMYLRSQLNIGLANSQWDYYSLNKNLIMVGMRYGFDL